MTAITSSGFTIVGLNRHNEELLHSAPCCVFGKSLKGLEPPTPFGDDLGGSIGTES